MDEITDVDRQIACSLKLYVVRHPVNVNNGSLFISVELLSPDRVQRRFEKTFHFTSTQLEHKFNIKYKRTLRITNNTMVILSYSFDQNVISCQTITSISTLGLRSRLEPFTQTKTWSFDKGDIEAMYHFVLTHS